MPTTTQDGTLELGRARDVRPARDGGLKLEEVARRAATTKPAIFRRSPSAVRSLLQGIAPDYPRLLDQRRRVSGDPKRHRLHA